MSGIEVTPATLTDAGTSMEKAAEELQNKTQAHLAEVSDLTILGTNDTLGGVCQIIYGTFLSIFDEYAQGLAGGYIDDGFRLKAQGEAYAALEEAQQQAIDQVNSEI